MIQFIQPNFPAKRRSLIFRNFLRSSARNIVILWSFQQILIFPSITPQCKATHIFILWRSKKRVSKYFPLHPHNFCDIITTIRGLLPIRMTFYSTQFSAKRRSLIFRNFPRNSVRSIVILWSFKKNTCFSLHHSSVQSQPHFHCVKLLKRASIFSYIPRIFVIS